ncbi:hypothetical protein [Thalassospira sp. UBA1131]|uniref:hypothetical protein n=1 Tax=Thalassospira sp. UBA1131 TaxID=1947672 RepID=UPI0025E10112|nr:hypothetical protein [Thalassospira sp. UBA1131]
MLDTINKLWQLLGIISVSFLAGQHFESERNKLYSQISSEKMSEISQKNQYLESALFKEKKENSKLIDEIRNLQFEKNSSGEVLLREGEMHTIFPGASFSVYRMGDSETGKQFATHRVGRKSKLSI